MGGPDKPPPSQICAWILNISRNEHVAKVLHYFIRKLVVWVELALILKSLGLLPVSYYLESCVNEE